mmetsp:Transcript_52814/g.115433  ORF Transcript_52814/g.115433 Transcript_52814/m.115433 type:complete len:1006 (-) Transcript_52814:126-3143(-)
MAVPDDELTHLLSGLASADGTIRSSAEATLAANRQHSGFASRVVVAATSSSERGLPDPLRQLALTVLKQLVNDHWPNLSQQDCQQVKTSLLQGLTVSSSTLRPLLHSCTAAVRCKGGHWPELIEILGNGLTRGTAHEAACCVDTVLVLLEDGGLEVALSLGPLQQSLLAIASSQQSPPALRRRCIEAHASGLTTLVAAAAIGSNPSATGALGVALEALPSWLAVHAALCTGCEGWSDQDKIACAFVAVRALTTLSRFNSLREVLSGCIEGVLRPASLLVQHIEGGYTQAIIASDDAGASDDEDAGPAQLVAQVMELLQAMLMGKELRPLLKSRVKSLLQLLVPFMRVTEAQCKAWREDPNEFLAHEEDDRVRGAAVRLSGEYLVGELLSHLKRESGRALSEMIGELLQRGERQRSEGDGQAWKLSELALLLYGIAVGGMSVKALQRSDFGQLLQTILPATGRLCQDKGAPDLLRARSFALLRRLGDAVCAMLPGDLPALLDAAACALTANEPMVVRVSACRAFCRFLTAVSDKSIRDRLLVERSVLASLGSLMRGADEELLHLTLESLCIIVRQCVDTIVSVADELSALVLEIWSRSRSDPLVGLQVLDLVSCATAGDQRLQVSLEKNLLPSILQDLQPGCDPHAASTSVQLLCTLMKRAAVPFHGALWQTMPLLIDLVMKSEESGFLENSCDLLVCLVQRSPAQVKEAGLVGPLLQCVQRLLSPGLDDNACVFVGPLLTLLLDKFGKEFPSDILAGLLQVVVRRLSQAKLPFLVQELLVVIGRLMHQDLQGVITTLGSQPVEGGGGGNNLELLLSLWLGHAEEVRAKRARNVTVTALCRLHERLLADPQLQSLRVPGPDGAMVVANLADRVLAVVLAALEFENGRARRSLEAAKKAPVDSDASDDNDDDDDGAGGKGRQADLLDYWDLLDDDDDDDEELEELLAGGGDSGVGGDSFFDLERSDPFHNIDLRQHAAEYLSKLQQPPSDQALSSKIATALHAATSR